MQEGPQQAVHRGMAQVVFRFDTCCPQHTHAGCLVSGVLEQGVLPMPGSRRTSAPPLPSRVCARSARMAACSVARPCSMPGG